MPVIKKKERKKEAIFGFGKYVKVIIGLNLRNLHNNVVVFQKHFILYKKIV